MNNDLAKRIVDVMYDQDGFSRWLGIERILIEQGHCILRMKIRKEMLNGFGSAHGGIMFSFADSALAFASNAYGRLSVALDCSISFPVAVKENDVLCCEAKELSLTNKTGTYLIEIKNQENKNVAFFKGTVYRTSREWFPDSTHNTDKESSENDENTKSVNTTQEESGEKLIHAELSYSIIGCAYDVFNQLGGGHTESVYQKALKESFLRKQLHIKEQIFYKVKYDEKTVGKNFFDFLVDEKIIVEIKAASKFSKANYDQVLNYLHVSKTELALLINFTSKQVEVKRVVNFDLINQKKNQY